MESAQSASRFAAVASAVGGTIRACIRMISSSSSSSSSMIKSGGLQGHVSSLLLNIIIIKSHLRVEVLPAERLLLHLGGSGEEELRHRALQP
jgi:hypothetical protein